MNMPGRKYQASPTSKYRYGLNGQEHSDDVSGENYTAEYWEYDSRIGRRWNLDPVVKADESSYATFRSNPIIYIDPNGADTIKFNRHTTIITPKQSSFSGGGQQPSALTSFSISTVTKEGSDVFLYINSFTEVKDNKVINSTSTTILHPDDNEAAAGLTKGKNLYFDGLITSERNNKDWESIGKLMGLDRGFNDYMVSRNPLANGWRARAQTYEVMEALLPVLVQSGLGAWVGFRLSGLSPSLSKLKYDPRVRVRALEDPVSHNFPYSFDRYVLNTKPILKPNGYKIYQLPGTMHGKIKNGVQQIKNGVYEIGMTSEGVIDHRFFRPL